MRKSWIFVILEFCAKILLCFPKNGGRNGEMLKILMSFC